MENGSCWTQRLWDELHDLSEAKANLDRAFLHNQNSLNLAEGTLSKIGDCDICSPKLKIKLEKCDSIVADREKSKKLIHDIDAICKFLRNPIPIPMYDDVLLSTGCKAKDEAYCKSQKRNKQINCNSKNDEFIPVSVNLTDTISGTSNTPNNVSCQVACRDKTATEIKKENRRKKCTNQLSGSMKAGSINGKLESYVENRLNDASKPDPSNRTQKNKVRSEKNKEKSSCFEPNSISCGKFENEKSRHAVEYGRGRSAYRVLTVSDASSACKVMERPQNSSRRGEKLTCRDLSNDSLPYKCPPGKKRLDSEILFNQVNISGCLVGVLNENDLKHCASNYQETQVSIVTLDDEQLSQSPDLIDDAVGIQHVHVDKLKDGLTIREGCNQGTKGDYALSGSFNHFQHDDDRSDQTVLSDSKKNVSGKNCLPSSASEGEGNETSTEEGPKHSGRDTLAVDCRCEDCSDDKESLVIDPNLLCRINDDGRWNKHDTVSSDVCLRSLKLCVLEDSDLQSQPKAVRPDSYSTILFDDSNQRINTGFELQELKRNMDGKRMRIECDGGEADLDKRNLPLFPIFNYSPKVNLNQCLDDLRNIDHKTKSWLKPPALVENMYHRSNGPGKCNLTHDKRMKELERELQDTKVTLEETEYLLSSSKFVPPMSRVIPET